MFRSPCHAQENTHLVLSDLWDSISVFVEDFLLYNNQSRQSLQAAYRLGLVTLLPSGVVILPL